MVHRPHFGTATNRRRTAKRNLSKQRMESIRRLHVCKQNLVNLDTQHSVARSRCPQFTVSKICLATRMAEQFKDGRSASVDDLTAPKKVAAVECIEVERTVTQAGRNIHEKNPARRKNFLRASPSYLSFESARDCKQFEQIEARFWKNPFRKWRRQTRRRQIEQMRPLSSPSRAAQIEHRIGAMESIGVSWRYCTRICRRKLSRKTPRRRVS